MKKWNLTLKSVAVMVMVALVWSCGNDDNELPIDEEDEGDPVGTVYFEENFDKMIWGGDYLANKPGLRPIFIQDPEQDNLRVIDESQNPVDCTPGADGSPDFFSPLAPSFLASRGFEEWDGRLVFERPGYIKIGTGSSRDGVVVTPAFSEITEDRVNLNVSFKIARWANASETVYIEIVGGGISSVSSLQVSNIASWAEREFSISNATSNTRIRFVCDPLASGRFFLGGIVVSKAE